ncbi:MAG: hypothetical protein AAGD34_03505 [Pseudomonadota bacterium]
MTPKDFQKELSLLIGRADEAGIHPRVVARELEWYAQILRALPADEKNNPMRPAGNKA